MRTSQQGPEITDGLDPYTLLPLLCGFVESQFSGQPACIAASALLVAAGEQFGVTLRPQPVSIWSGDRAGQSATGHRARDFGLSMGAKVRSNTVTEGDSDWFHSVGHLIAVSDEHRVLLDSTYGQFPRPGTDRRTVVMQVPSMSLAGDQEWALQEGEWHVKYWPVNSPDTWKLEYEDAQRLIVPIYLPAVVRLVRNHIIQ